MELRLLICVGDMLKVDTVVEAEDDVPLKKSIDRELSELSRKRALPTAEKIIRVDHMKALDMQGVFDIIRKNVDVSQSPEQLEIEKGSVLGIRCTKREEKPRLDQHEVRGEFDRLVGELERLKKAVENDLGSEQNVDTFESIVLERWAGLKKLRDEAAGFFGERSVLVSDESDARSRGEWRERVYESLYVPMEELGIRIGEALEFLTEHQKDESRNTIPSLTLSRECKTEVERIYQRVVPSFRRRRAYDVLKAGTVWKHGLWRNGKVVSTNDVTEMSEGVPFVDGRYDLRPKRTQKEPVVSPTDRRFRINLPELSKFNLATLVHDLDKLEDREHGFMAAVRKVRWTLAAR